MHENGSFWKGRQRDGISKSEWEIMIYEWKGDSWGLCLHESNLYMCKISKNYMNNVKT